MELLSAEHSARAKRLRPASKPPTLFTIAGDLESMDIHARVDETDIGRIKMGQNATFTVDAYPGHRFEAEVIAVRKAPQQQEPANSILRRTPLAPSNVVTYTVVLRTSNPGTLLLPGMTAVLRIVVQEAKDVLTVPMAALRFSPREKEGQYPVGQPRASTVWLWDAAKNGIHAVRVEVETIDGIKAGVTPRGPIKGRRSGDNR